MTAGAGLLALLLLVVVLAIVTGPLRRSAGERAATDGDRAARRRAAEILDLEAAREAKYRELRDAELDHRTGKLSESDYESIRRTLRGEASDILSRLEAARDDSPAAPARSGEREARHDAGEPQDGSAHEGSGELQQGDRVGEQQNREDHGPAVEVALDQRAAAERPRAAAHSEGAGEPGVLAGVHQDQKDQHHGD
jgi:hypothetical protein